MKKSMTELHREALKRDFPELTEDEITAHLIEGRGFLYCILGLVMFIIWILVYYGDSIYKLIF